MRRTARSVSGSSPIEMGIRPATIVERHFNLARAVDDMAVRQHETVRADNKTRAAARAHFAATGDMLHDLDVDDGVADGIGGLDHGARISVKQFAVVDDGWQVAVGVVGVETSGLPLESRTGCTFSCSQSV